MPRNFEQAYRFVSVKKTQFFDLQNYQNLDTPFFEKVDWSGPVKKNNFGQFYFIIISMLELLKKLTGSDMSRKHNFLIFKTTQI